jgi:hypothetical protein
MAYEKQAVEVTTEQQFDAYTIIASDKYRRYRDLLTCLLNEDVMYTESDIDKILNQALNTPVKG